MVQTFKLDKFGYEVELGKIARQADGAVWFKQGGTVVLATVVSAPSEDFPGFLPLTIEYREKYSAAGKIPGGYFKREGRPSDREVLTSRMIDRALRPLFPANFFDQVQIIITTYSVDKEHDPAAAAFIAASMALQTSKIPFLGPVGMVEASRVDGAWIMNPTYPQSVASDMRIIIAGTQEGICMVEGSTNELSEEEFIDVLFKAHDHIKELVSWQEEVTKKIGNKKEEIADPYNWETWTDRVNKFLTDEHVDRMYIEDKAERNLYLASLREQFTQQYAEEILTTEVPSKVLNYIFDDVLKEKLTEQVFAKNKRVDGRADDQIRHISGEVGVLPFVHGSALFTRGQTQALVSVTLGGGQDAQRLESVMVEGEQEQTFMLHYNFPPFSTGEVRFLRGPGRREVGHGYLAGSAFTYVLPEKEKFPYTILVSSDILESNGSSSMATVCGSTMAMMQAGIPIKKMVSGIAMGLLQSKKGGFKVISDISGLEDAFGLMDFKVVGTDKGITAIQMDIKYKGGLSRQVFEKALEQARAGRLFILSKMQEVIDKPYPLSDLVPKVTVIKIDTDKIGAVIGTGGKTIREIIEKTGTTIDIEEDGTVKIFGGPKADVKASIRWVRTLAGQIDKGEIFEGKIRKVAEFGLFVELVPGQDGLVHVSNIPRALQKTFMKHFTVDQVVKVEVLDHDPVSGRTSLRLLEQ